MLIFWITIQIIIAIFRITIQIIIEIFWITIQKIIVKFWIIPNFTVNLQRNHMGENTSLKQHNRL